MIQTGRAKGIHHPLKWRERYKQTSPCYIPLKEKWAAGYMCISSNNIIPIIVRVVLPFLLTQCMHEKLPAVFWLHSDKSKYQPSLNSDIKNIYRHNTETHAIKWLKKKGKTKFKHVQKLPESHRNPVTKHISSSYLYTQVVVTAPWFCSGVHFAQRKHLATRETIPKFNKSRVSKLQVKDFCNPHCECSKSLLWYQWVRHHFSPLSLLFSMLWCL